MRRLKLIWISLLPILVVGLGFTALVGAQPPTQVSPPTATPELSACVPDLRKWVDPNQLLLGGAADVTMVVSETCPGVAVPVDMVLLADESNSMTKLQQPPSAKTATVPSLPTEHNTPDPNQSPTHEPPNPPTQGPPIGGTPRRGTGGNEPPFCNPNQGLVPVQPTEVAPTHPVPPQPTLPVPEPTHEPPVPPMPLRAFQVVPPAPPTEPGPIIPGPVVPHPSATPTTSIDDLEPPGGTDQVREIKNWIGDFLAEESIQRDLANGQLRLSFVSFSDRARIRQSLTSQASKITGAASHMRGDNVTRIQQGLTEAGRQLTNGEKTGSPDRAKVILILSDFQFCDRDVRPSTLHDVQVVSIGFGVRAYDQKKMYDLATKREYVFSPRDLKRIVDIYDTDLHEGRAVTVSELKVSDQLTDTMRLIPGSASPPTVTITGQLLEWEFAPPSFPITLGYSIEPQKAGVWPVSQKADALWTDSESLSGSAPFPRVIIDVSMPTPTYTSTPTETLTPTATHTPTPTPTPTPAAAYLPIVIHNWPPATPTPIPPPTPTKCIPEAQTVDVAEVIDTSTSMSAPTTGGGIPKLQAAIAAAQELVNLLKAADQASIIGFNNQANLETGLTTDRALLAAALARLPSTQATGTRIDTGLQVAFDELTGPNHRAENNRSIVLVTDGVNTDPEGPAKVYAIADRIKAEGIKLITVGLGSDVDDVLLRSIASEPDLYFQAPNAEDLMRIYRDIALVIPCP